MSAAEEEEGCDKEEDDEGDADGYAGFGVGGEAG